MISKLIAGLLIALSLNLQAEDINILEKGIVNFHADSLSGYDGRSQPINWYGCNPTNSGVGSVNWRGNSSSELPYGLRSDGGKSYFAARYYLASPPVPANPAPGQQTTLGLLKPDSFTFTSIPPVQDVTLDYNVLKPMYLQFIDINYGNCEGKVNTIPINTVCPKFPHVEGEPRLASGIGVLENMDDASKIFLPSEDAAGLSPLQCEATILNDIQLHYKISFLVKEAITETLNLTSQFKTNPNIPVVLLCEERPVSYIPPGCSNPSTRSSN
jgi:hypothetical protein